MDTTTITSALGAAAGLGGFTLVFLGVLIGTIQAYSGETAQRVLSKYQRPAGFALAAFLLCMVSVVLSFTWLLHPSRCLYWIAVISFYVAIVSVVVVAIVVVRQIVWRK